MYNIYSHYRLCRSSIKTLPAGLSILVFLYLAISCGMPPHGTNTEPVKNGTDIKYGQQYVYSCAAGYKFVTDSTVTCTKDGFFDSLPPFCTGKCNK